MGLMAVTNVGAGVNAEFASVQLVEVPKDSPDPSNPIVNPQGNSVVNLVVPVADAGNYPVGTQWDMTLTRADK